MMIHIVHGMDGRLTTHAIMHARHECAEGTILLLKGRNDYYHGLLCTCWVWLHVGCIVLLSLFELFMHAANAVVLLLLQLTSKKEANAS